MATAPMKTAPIVESDIAAQKPAMPPPTPKHHLTKYQMAFELTSFVLAVLAITFAIIQFLDSRRLKADVTHVAGSMSAQAVAVRQVAESMSTEAIAEFPKNMEEITRVVAGSKKELDIMADLPGYGQYSRPDASAIYLEKLKELRPDVTVKMLLYDRPSAKQSRKRQFADRTFQQLKTDKRFKHYFHEVWPTLAEPNDTNSFIEQLQKKQDDFERDLLEKQIEIRHVSGRLLFYLWLQDNQEAIFSFQNNAKTEHEISFHTRDGNLISTFKETFDQMWKSANVLRPVGAGP